MGSVGLDRYGPYVERWCIVGSRTDHTICHSSRYILLLFNTRIDTTQYHARKPMSRLSCIALLVAGLELLRCAGLLRKEKSVEIK